MLVQSNLSKLFFAIGSLISDLPLCYRIGTLRGVLTNGMSWMFLILALNHNEDGATYQYSKLVTLQPDEHLGVARPWPDVVAGILLHWVSYESTFSNCFD